MTPESKGLERSDASSHEDSPDSALKLLHTLQGHTDGVYRMALSPDGHILASPSMDGTINLWNCATGGLVRQLVGNYGGVNCVAWSSDGKLLASGGSGLQSTVNVWHAQTGELINELRGHGDLIVGVAWHPKLKAIASGSDDKKVIIWDLDRDLQKELSGHNGKVSDISWSPSGKWLCSGSWDYAIQIWDVDTGKPTRTLKGSGHIQCVAWSPDGRLIVSGSNDQIVRVWDAETGQQRYVLEGYTQQIVSVSFLDGGRLLASLGEGGAVILWRTDTWTEVMHVDKIGKAGLLANLATHPILPIMATPGSTRREINLWSLDTASLLGIEPSTTTVHYVNAKAVLLGDSGVGKSGLGIRLAEGEFRKTDSTHGAQFWHFPTERLPSMPPNVQAELTLWDLAGQPEYRLIHQLFVNDTDIALLLFDCSDPSDPFRGVPYWAKVLRKHAPPHSVKFLISARCDVSPITVDRREINRTLATYGLDEYFRTSARKGEGVEELFSHLLSCIPWEQLPRTSTPRLFQVLRELLLEYKEAGKALIDMTDLRQAARERFDERAATQEELDTVVRLLQSRGLVHRLDPRPTLALVLLRPEMINQYGSSIIQAARNHPLGIGAVPERDVLIGDLRFHGFDRLHKTDESLVLEATAELLIRRDLCFREMGYLIFPSQINITRLTPTATHPRTEVAYRFSGSIETIYASLVVRLSYTSYFQREDQWKYAVEFSRNGDRLGFSMRQIEEGTGELEVYFYQGISEFDRVTFIRFVTDHLRAKGIDIQEQIRLYCPKCSKEVTNHEAIDARIRDGYLDIPCQYCATAILISKSVEERYRRDPSLGKKQKKLAEVVEKRTLAEVKKFRADQQYVHAKDLRIHILHLSDLHLKDDQLAGVYRTQLESDLIEELGIRRLGYLVLSGDVTHRADEEEYRAAFAMLDGLVKRFGLDPGRIIIVPGNHDVNWALSKKSYPFVYRDDLPSPLSTDRHIPAGETGALLRDDLLYRERFSPFNDHLYRRIYGQEYPLDYADQALWIERSEDRILFLGLNSCWQLDHHFRNRAGIHMQALTRALDRFRDGAYDGWLKIAVWHHPITGQQGMNDEFVQLLTIHGFQVCLHGHIHEAIEGYHKYDKHRGLRIIGAGSFSAEAKEQVSGIPLQYNILSFDARKYQMTVITRRKEKPDGAWAADARWGNKNNPKPSYVFQIPHYNPKS